MAQPMRGAGPRRRCPLGCRQSATPRLMRPVQRSPGGTVTGRSRAESNSRSAGLWRRIARSCMPFGLAILAASPAVSAGAQEHLVPLFPAASDTVRQGFVRVINHGDESGEVSIEAIDDDGNVHGPLALSIGAGETVHFNSDDLEEGNPGKGLTGYTGSGHGDWRLDVTSDLDIEVLAYIRTGDGFLTAMHDLVPQTDDGHRAATFNPGRNANQVSRLRLINPGDTDATVTVHGIDDTGTRSADVQAIVPAGATRTYSAAQLENGADGLTDAMGSGSGKWQLLAASDAPIHAMSLLQSPTGHLTNLSTTPANDSATHVVPMFPPNVADGPQGFVRVINRGDASGEVTIAAFDDDGREYGAASLAIEANHTLHFNSKDLEEGHSGKGLTGTGQGEGDWRLELTSDLDIQVLAYVRTPDGFLTAMHDTAPTADNRHRVAVFNPGTNKNQLSWLRILNPSAAAASVDITGIDDAGEYSDYLVQIDVPPGGSRSLDAEELEDLGLGDGRGKWQLVVESEQSIIAMSLLATPTGHFTNLSTAPGRGAEFPDNAEDVFSESVSQTVVQENCIGCHTEGGRSGHTRLVFVDSSNADHVERNLAQFRNLLGDVDRRYILDKINNVSGHGGGIRIERDSETYRTLERFLVLLQGELRRAAGPLDVVQSPIPEGIGHPVFASPHSKPIAAVGDFVYVTNTPSDTVDVIDARTRTIVNRINVGIDPVSVVPRPDGLEVWVANHISDTVSVIDTDPASPTFQNVVATVQAVDAVNFSTDFDEPVGIAFASNEKAYVALGPANEIAVVNVATRSVGERLGISSQDPRAIAVQGERLYVVAFESGNKSQLSGCFSTEIGQDGCTFDAVEHVFSNNNVLSLNYDADITEDDDVPDRDLFVFDTTTDELVAVVEGVGTLLYGITVDGSGRVYVAQTDARNTANGLAGTQGHGMAEMENRAFLNQVTRIDCGDESGCGAPVRFDLEPVPPDHPEPEDALATPFGIQISPDDSTLVVTAAGSDKLFTVDATSGEVLGSVDVENAPRGVAVVSGPEGEPIGAWVLNAVANSVSAVDLSSLTAPTVAETIPLEDPTHPVVKQGRMAFNDAHASSTGTFSCESCHPDNHTDQLIWILQTPPCEGQQGCMDQVPPRLTMPAKGLRDTQPYHWDGIPGDPYGGINTASIDAPVEPNCSEDDPQSCTRVLVDGSLATTMCDVSSGACPHTNDEGKAGLLDAGDRDALATYLLSVPFPPAQKRPFDNELTQMGRDGIFEFSFIIDSGQGTGAQTCGDCHRMPFLVTPNTPGTGMDAPTWRGAYDRFQITPQARTNVIDLMYLAFRRSGAEPQSEFNERFYFEEEDIWDLGGASPEVWQMVLQNNTGFSGSFARQVTLNEDTARRPLTEDLLDALEVSGKEGGIILQGEGVLMSNDGATGVALEFSDGVYRTHDGSESYDRSELLHLASDGELVLTLTGRSGANIDKHMQPALWPVAPIHRQSRNVHLAFLDDDRKLRINARHVQAGASLHLNGRRIDGNVECEHGTLPHCSGEVAIIELDQAPPGGLHFVQIQNPQGLFSNDMMFFHEDLETMPSAGNRNLISSGGEFNRIRFDRHNWNFVNVNGIVRNVDWGGGEMSISLTRASSDRWHSQISHAVPVVGGQTYTLCYDAKSSQLRDDQTRPIRAYMDTNMDNWRNTSGGQFEEDLTSTYQQFSHTFTIAETDLRGRVAFDFGQSAYDVQMDNIGLYEGTECGDPRKQPGMFPGAP
ncbi:MAG: hypothetical protein F4029_04595 [Gammaproteobacteria bacterium]|nr:hypothetical protein [Gammaproteobacteria bacterium]MYK45491.1 hypothetical protein [Gammaproteobacteria bacterium]